MCSPSSQEVSLASCVFEGEGLTECIAGATASFRVRACDARGYTVVSTAAEFTLMVIVDGKEIPGTSHPTGRLTHHHSNRGP